MLKVGFDQVVIDDFLEVFVEQVSKLKHPANNLVSLIVNDPVYSDYLIMLMRMLTSSSLQNNLHKYSDFLDESMYLTISDFCQKEVDPIDREADHLQIIALIDAIHIPIQIIYIDNHSPTTSIIFPSQAQIHQIQIHMLYRPGHYDLLYLNLQ